MYILKFIILLSLIFFNVNYVEAKGIPYCSKKITRGCVKQKRGKTAKFYFAPKYDEHKSLAKVKPKKLAKNTNHKKVKKAKRGTASILELKLKKKKKKESK